MKNFDRLVIETISQHPEYSFWKTCIDFEDGMEVYDIVEQDYLQYPENTYYHNPELEISPQNFQDLVGKAGNIRHFYGYNQKQDIIFDYNPKTDIHSFYKK
jgi:hypothetical protein